MLVTSRNRLTGLAVGSARLLSLDVLTHDEAVQILVARLGRDRRAFPLDALAAELGARSRTAPERFPAEDTSPALTSLLPSSPAF